MLLSTQTDALARRHGDAQAIRILKEKGFDAFDMSFFRMFGNKEYEMNGPGYLDYAKMLRETADEAGIVCNQAHAPFASSTGDEAKDEEIFAAILRSMEAAAVLGAKNIIVHPKHHIDYDVNKKEIKEMNMAFYRRLIPYCQDYGICVSCENMWQHNKAAGRIIDSVCSRPEEFKEYLDELDSPWINACLDVGHVLLTDENLPNYVRILGKKHLQALHVHDNDLIHDTHTLPFTHSIDYKGFLKALAEIGYEGDMTFEADSFIARMPRELEDDALAFMERVGRYLISQVR